MRDTVKSLLESSVAPHMDIATKNRVAFSELRPVSEEASQLMKFTPQKVIIDKVMRDTYMIEYTGNIERLMKDQDMTISEAVECVANMNNIAVENCIVVFDESYMMSGVDVTSVVSECAAFAVARK